MLRLMKHPTTYCLALIVIVVGGCATSQPRAPQPVVTPIGLGPEGSSPITFSKLIFRLQSGSELGAHHDGLLRVPQFRHRWNGGILVGSDEFRIIACDQLRSRGYKVMGGENLLFAKDEGAKAEYQLGGTVIGLTHNTYAPLAGNF